MTDFYLMENTIPVIRIPFLKGVIVKPFDKSEFYNAIGADYRAGEKAVVIEREAIVRKLISDLLKEKKVSVYAFSNPVDAIDHYKEIRPELVIAGLEGRNENSELSALWAMKIYDRLQAQQN